MRYFVPHNTVQDVSRRVRIPYPAPVRSVCRPSHRSSPDRATVRMPPCAPATRESSIEYQAVSRLRPLTIMCCRKMPSKVNPSRIAARLRRQVERVALPFVAPVAEVLEDMTRHQVHRLGSAGGPLQRRGEEDAADLNRRGVPGRFAYTPRTRRLTRSLDRRWRKIVDRPRPPFAARLPFERRAIGKWPIEEIAPQLIVSG